MRSGSSWAYIISRRNHFPRAAEPLTWKETGAILRTSALSMMLPIIIVGGILGGIFTPTEAAAVGAAYAIFLCVCILRTLPLRALPGILFESAKISSIIWLLLATTNILVWVLAINNVGPAVERFFLSVSGNVYVFLLILNLFLLVVGMLMDTFPAIMILAPLLHPLAVQLGVHPLHFGIIMSVNLLIGQITPPVGTNLFILSAIGHISIERLFSRRHSLPAHRDRGPFYPYVRACVDAVDPTNARVSLGESSGAGIETGGAFRLRPQIRG